MPAGASGTGIVHSGRGLCSHTVEVSKVEYNFDVRCGQTTVVYVQTMDGDFQTPEGVSIGQLLRDALKTNRASLERIDGQCGVALSSGWIARAAPATTRGSECDSLLDEPISYFDTPSLDH